MKKWYASKTLWFNLLAGVVMVASQFGYLDFEPSPMVATIATLVVAIINMILRYWFTNTALQR